ncbi:hypothetical protein EV122DRAFT_269089 [Schizophyllum commune]
MSGTRPSLALIVYAFAPGRDGGACPPGVGCCVWRGRRACAPNGSSCRCGDVGIFPIVIRVALAGNAPLRFVGNVAS